MTQELKLHLMNINAPFPYLVLESDEENVLLFAVCLHFEAADATET